MRLIKRLLTSVARPLGLLSAYHYFLAFFSSVIYRHPSREMKVVGVTGTKGKTTVVMLLNAIFEASGEKVVLISSNRFQVGEESRVNQTGNTMPGRGFIQKTLRRGVGAGCKFGIVEVVSEGVLQHRDRFIDFDVAVFIGLHPEHIESHGGLENYREAKLDFFRHAMKSKKKTHFVINRNNEHSKYFADVVREEDTILYDSYDGELKIEGDFNRKNAAAAAAAARALGISDEVIRRALASFEGVPGRMEFVAREPFKVVVDYAHTPDSLEAVYRNLGKNLICVLGSAGGHRDRWKRPKLGEIATEYCKEIILTDEDPFDENPRSILEDIKEGIKSDNVRELLDRGDAIREAIGMAKEGDTVIITGKGSEPYIRVAGGKRVDWSDVRVVKEAIEDLP